jgi:hypothetical protein
MGRIEQPDWCDSILPLGEDGRQDNYGLDHPKETVESQTGVISEEHSAWMLPAYELHHKGPDKSVK